MRNCVKNGNWKMHENITENYVNIWKDEDKYKKSIIIIYWVYFLDSSIKFKYRYIISIRIDE